MLTIKESKSRKKSRISYYNFLASKAEDVYRLPCYDIRDIYDVRCSNKIFRFTIKLDFDNWDYYKPYNMAIKRDIELLNSVNFFDEEYHKRAQYFRKNKISNIHYELRDDPPIY